jgi:putative CocE/NonD family hydrolase
MGTLFVVVVPFLLPVSVLAWPDERPAQFQVTCKEVKVPMRDGTQLAADLYLPETSGPFPVIIERTPYDKNNCDFRNAKYFAERGFAVLIQDVRGRFASPGDFYQFRDEGWGRRQDGYDTIEWAGTQPWSTGKVGTMGTSYSCFNQNMTAPTQPPHLTAMFCNDSSHSWFIHRYAGGALNSTGLNWFVGNNEAARPVSENQDRAEDWLSWHVRRIERNQSIWESWESQNMVDTLGNSTYNDYWRQYAPIEHIEKFQIPVYYKSGWYDRYPHSATLMFNEIRKRAGTQLARQSVKLIIGPWLHGGSNRQIGDLDFGADAAINLPALMSRWFDYHLRGIDNGIMKEPPVRVFMMGANRWREEKDFPVARAVQTKFFLTSARSGSSDSPNDGSLSLESPPAGDKPDTYEFDPRNPIISIGGDLFVQPMGARDHRPADRRSLTFTTAPLTEDLEVAGPSTAELYVSSTTDDTDFVVTLIDVHPNGFSQILRQNILRASRRESLEEPTPIVPKRVYKLTIPIYPVGNVFLKGHRMRLTVSSSSFPRWLPNHNKFMEDNEKAPWTTTFNTIYHDTQRPSTLVVPVIPPAQSSAVGSPAAERAQNR